MPPCCLPVCIEVAVVARGPSGLHRVKLGRHRRVPSRCRGGAALAAAADLDPVAGRVLAPSLRRRGGRRGSRVGAGLVCDDAEAACFWLGSAQPAHVRASTANPPTTQIWIQDFTAAAALPATGSRTRGSAPLNQRARGGAVPPLPAFTAVVRVHVSTLDLCTSPTLMRPESTGTAHAS